MSDKKLLPVSYYPPQYNGCQLLCELVATETKLLWFGSCSKESLALSFIDLDGQKWRRMFELAQELYGGKETCKPSSLHDAVRFLREDIKEFVMSNCEFVAEVPTVNCFDDKSLDMVPMPGSRFYRLRQNYPTVPNDVNNVEEINESILGACKLSANLIRKSHQLERRKATELLLFVVTDSDRLFCKDKPSSIPVAFALKGRSIRTSTARKLINQVRDKMKEKNIPILCECMDGQWAAIVFRDEQNRPLTIYELQRDATRKFARMSKDRCLDEIRKFSSVNVLELNKLESVSIENLATYRFGNIEMHISLEEGPKEDEVRRILTATSFCGPYNMRNVLGTFRTVWKSKRPDLWHIELGIKVNLLQVLGLERPPIETSAADEDQESDEQVLELRHQLIQEGDVEDDENFLPDLNTTTQIKQILLGSHSCILEEFLLHLLCGTNHDKWSSLELSDLYDEYLSSTQKIFQGFTSHELDLFIKTLRTHESKKCKLPPIGKGTKNLKANQLGFLLGHSDRITPKKKKLGLVSLKKLCLEEIRVNVPLPVVQHALQRWEYLICLPNWLRLSPVPMTIKLPGQNEDFDCFSYPEFSETRNQIESRLIDPSHILTNLRLHATQKGFFKCDPKAFKRVSQVNNDILGRALLETPLPDKQSVPFARKVFSREVEQQMKSNGDDKEAELVHNIRNWYDACNERGIPLEKRLKYFVQMNNYMFKFYDPQRFPVSMTHICGLPSTTFQGILHNISCRIILYGLSDSNTYNQRALSTLAVESFFSDLSQVAHTTSGIPMAANVPRYLSRMSQLNKIRDDPTK